MVAETSISKQELEILEKALEVLQRWCTSQQTGEYCRDYTPLKRGTDVQAYEEAVCAAENIEDFVWDAKHGII